MKTWSLMTVASLLAVAVPAEAGAPLDRVQSAVTAVIEIVTRPDLQGRRRQRALGQGRCGPQALDLGRELHRPHPSHQGLAIDQLRLRRQVAEQHRQPRREAVGRHHARWVPSGSAPPFVARTS